MSDIYAITVYRYKNNELCSAFEEAKENEDFVRLVDFNATEKRLKKRIRELSEKQAEDRQSYYECLHKQEPIKPNNKNCNLTTCRYNADGKCTNEEKRKECVRVSKAVLIIDDLADIEVPDNQLVKKHKDVTAMKTNIGTEHGIKWETEWNGENIRITVSTEDGRKTETRYYNCKYPVVCGYDVYDCNKVEEMLDEMIVKYANDGYKGSGK